MATYYVRPDGNNNNAGTGPAANQAWATLTKAGSVANDDDIVYIAPGTYRETFAPVNAGSAGHLVNFIADKKCANFPGLTPGDIIISGINTEADTAFARGSCINPMAYNRFVGFTIENTTTGIYNSPDKTCVYEDITILKNVKDCFIGGGTLIRCKFKALPTGKALCGYGGAYRAIDATDCIFDGCIDTLGGTSFDTSCIFTDCILNGASGTGFLYTACKASFTYNFQGCLIYFNRYSNGTTLDATGVSNTNIIFNYIGCIFAATDNYQACGVQFSSGAIGVAVTVKGCEFLNCYPTVNSMSGSVTMSNIEVVRSQIGASIANVGLTITYPYFHECITGASIGTGQTLTLTDGRFYGWTSASSGGGTLTNTRPTYGENADEMGQGYFVSSRNPIAGAKSLKFKGCNYTPVYIQWVPCEAGKAKKVKLKARRARTGANVPAFKFGDQSASMADGSQNTLTVSSFNLYNTGAIANYVEGAYATSNVTNGYYNLRFKGTNIKIKGSKNEGYGIAAVSVDGGTESNVDTYATPASYHQELYSVTGLTNDWHTINIRVTGTKNASASGHQITVEGFEVDSKYFSAYNPIQPIAENVQTIELTYTHHKTELIPLMICGRVDTSGFDYFLVDDIAA